MHTDTHKTPCLLLISQRIILHNKVGHLPLAKILSTIVSGGRAHTMKKKIFFLLFDVTTKKEEKARQRVNVSYLAVGALEHSSHGWSLEPLFVADCFCGGGWREGSSALFVVGKFFFLCSQWFVFTNGH
jgi:hypothetical protein